MQAELFDKEDPDVFDAELFDKEDPGYVLIVASSSSRTGKWN